MNNATAAAAKKKLYSNLLHKLNANKTFSKTEKEQFDELSEFFDEQSKPSEPESKTIHITNPQIAKLFNVTPATVCNWAKAGMPKASHGSYDLFLVMDWWMENINTDPNDVATSDARGRYWNAKAEQAEIDVMVKKEMLVPASKIYPLWAQRCAELRQSLLALPVKLPPVLEGVSSTEMRGKLKAAVVGLLNAYTRNGRFTPLKRSKK